MTADPPEISDLAADGMRFQAITPSPLCAPSRGAILTGLHGHNNGIVTDGGNSADLWRAKNLGHTVADWLHRAGWRTEGFGKGVNTVPLPALTAQGWDAWHESQPRVAGADRYWLDVLTDQAVAAIESTLGDRPLFLYFAPQSPHAPFVSDPKYRGAYDSIPLPEPPSMGRNGGKLSRGQVRKVTALFHKRLEMMRSVADSIGRIRDALERTGRAGDAYSFFVSDNGYSQGEGGRTNGKGQPYAESVSVPAFVLGPDVPAGFVSDALIYNHDFAPTIAALAGVRPDRELDGRPFSALWRMPGSAWRRRVLLEHHDARALLFSGLETRAEKLIVWQDGGRALYDLDLDPFELDNRCAPNRDCGGRLMPVLDALMHCAGRRCWELETRP